MANNDETARKQAEARLIDRAMKDPAFRAELIADPKGVFKRELGIELPNNLKIQVLEDKPGTLHVVLPPSVAQADAELSDADVGNVAGAGDSAAGESVCICDTVGPCSQGCT